MSPPMLILLRLTTNEHQFLAEKQIFIEIFKQISDSMADAQNSAPAKNSLLTCCNAYFDNQSLRWDFSKNMDRKRGFYAINGTYGSLMIYI